MVSDSTPANAALGWEQLRIITHDTSQCTRSDAQRQSVSRCDQKQKGVGSSGCEAARARPCYRRSGSRTGLGFSRTYPKSRPQLRRGEAQASVACPGCAPNAPRAARPRGKCGSTALGKLVETLSRHGDMCAVILLKAAHLHSLSVPTVNI